MSATAPPSLPEPPRPQATLGRLARLTLKELREILRDRRTIVTLVLMPVLVYPLLSIGFRQFFLTRLASESRPTYRVGFVEDAQGFWFRMFLDEYGDPADATPASEPAPIIEFYTHDDLETAVDLGVIDVGIRLSDFDPQRLERARTLAQDVELIVLDGYVLGQRAADHFERAVARANVRFLDQQLGLMRIRQRAEPVRTVRETIPSDEPAQGVSLLTALPLILILMTITGAVYPAIDLTAGERERGTLEILVAAPVPRLGLLLAKYVSVLTVALLTATVNLATMSLTIVLSGLGPTLMGEEGLTPLVIAQVFALLVLFAGFFSAVLLSLTSFARSFKEAQAYLIPLMLLSLAPGLMSMIPGLELKGFLAVAPLVNIVLLGRDLLEQNVDPLMAAIVVASNFFYAAAAIGAAAKVFGSEDVLFNVQGAWSDWLQRPPRPRPAPTVSTALFCLALIFPAFFVITSSLGQLADLPLGTRLAFSGASTALLFAGFPLAAAWLRRDPLASAFQLTRPPLLAIPAAVLLGASLWPWAHELIVWQHELGLITLGEQQLERAREFLSRARGEISLPVLLVSLALLPGVCEELLFRGYLFRALRTQLSGQATVICTGLLFGGFHLITDHSLAIERLLPSTLLGFALGWVCLRTGSTIPGMILHVCHNGLLLTLAWLQPLLSQRWDIQEQSHLPGTWLAAAAVLALAGAWLGWLGEKGKTGKTRVAS
jgi:ABC-2 type transport system permease protein/sodium transport system permease protein